ncbi:MAG TPA: serine/threonine protein kinase, partial [Polyangiaceae bacterium]|nr:serine/threonine protein kinase [Polyangiaceae bacterium]
MKRDDPELSGEILAERYRLITPVGRGAMGAVWRASDLASGRDVAVKLVDGRRDGTNRAARFLREGRAMARLHSPHVVGILDHGRCAHPIDDGEIAFLVMELLEGESLARRLDREDRLDAATTVRIIDHVGRGIALAHARGIVHRDLKPANIFLSGPPPLTAKVLDFGLAKPWAPLPDDGALHTTVGKPLGTPYYMSPEQCRGLASVDHRSDLWALGVITYECLCGRKPFDARTIPELFERIAGANPAPPSTLTSCPEELDRWMRRALASDVQRRFQSAAEMVSDLRDALGVDDASIPPPRPSVDDALHTRMLVAHGLERTIRRLPDRATRLIGRDHLVGQIADAVASHCRVITLHGNRGVGRGALAEIFAEDHRGSLSGGIWRVPLAHCETARQMMLAFAAVLETTAAFGEAGFATCLASFGPAIVLVTDADRVRDPLNRLVARVLRDAPQVIMVVTSSHPLQAPTERALPVGSLTASEAGCLLANRIDELGDRTTPTDRDDLPTPMLEAGEATGGNALVARLLADAWARGVGEATTARVARAEGRGDRRLLSQLDAIIDSLPGEERAALARCGSRRALFSAEAMEALGVTRPQLTKLLRRGYVVQTRQNTQPFMLHPLVRRACSRRLAAGRDLADDPSAARSAARDLLTRHAMRVAALAARPRLLELEEAGDARMRRFYVDLYADA